MFVKAGWSPQGIAAKMGLAGRMGLDLITHLIPKIPNFHLNGTEGLSDEDARKLQHDLTIIAQQSGMLSDDDSGWFSL